MFVTYSHHSYLLDPHNVNMPVCIRDCLINCYLIVNFQKVNY